MEENPNLQQPLVANNGNNNQRKCPTSIYPNTVVKEIDFVIFFLELISIVPSVLIFIFLGKYISMVKSPGQLLLIYMII